MPGRAGNGGLTSRRMPVRSVQDLERAARALATNFKTDVVVIVGSQSILVGWPDAPILMRTSPEIDAYPANARLWEKEQRDSHPDDDFLASEEINALFGDMSQFFEAHGFYIDGVDDRTAKLPLGWQARAVYREVESYGTTVTVIAPCPEDMIAAKMGRLAEKDIAYIKAYHEVRPLNPILMSERVRTCGFEPEIVARAEKFFADLPQPSSPVIGDRQAFPRLPRAPFGTHCVFIDRETKSVVVRKWDEKLCVFNRIDNPIGPAFVSWAKEEYAIGGRRMSLDEWKRHPAVIEACTLGAPKGPRPPWVTADEE